MNDFVMVALESGHDNSSAHAYAAAPEIRLSQDFSGFIQRNHPRAAEATHDDSAKPAAELSGRGELTRPMTGSPIISRRSTPWSRPMFRWPARSFKRQASAIGPSVHRREHRHGARPARSAPAFAGSNRPTDDPWQFHQAGSLAVPWCA